MMAGKMVGEPTEGTAANTAATANTANTADTAATVPQGPRKVKIKLHRGRTEAESADVFVSVNGMRFQIQRGVEVEVPYYVAEVLENSERQDMAAARRRDALKARMAQ